MIETKGNTSTGCLIGGLAGVAGFGLGILSLFFLGFLLLIFAFSSGEKAKEDVPHIAHIDIEGMISGSGMDSWAGRSQSMVETVNAQLKSAEEDSNAKAVVIRINSPGGEVTAADTIYNEVKKLAAKKPVIIYMDGMAASGGYYIACAGREIWANETTLTGSIGVIMSGLNYSQLFEKVGLQSMTFTSGKFKDVMSGTRAMTPDEQALINGLVMDMYERFLVVVKGARKDIPDAELRANIADGRLFTAGEAKKVRLVDSLGYIEDAYNRARELSKAGMSTKVIHYSKPSGMFGLMGALERMSNPKVEVKLPEAVAPSLKPGVPYLLPFTYAN